MSQPAIFADFNNADPRGRVRLNTIGTIEDLSRQGIQLREGMKIILHDDDLEADGEVHFSTEEKTWIAMINWQAIRQKLA